MTAVALADTKLWAYWWVIAASLLLVLNVITPVCFLMAERVIELATAEINVWAVVLVDGTLFKTCISKVLVVTLYILTHWPLIGSVARG